jgi:hypothetical protein
MFKTLKNSIIRNAKNIPGWRTSRKILVFECDDWGGIRMPSRQVYEKLAAGGLNVATSRFNRLDTLETGKDLELLFETLDSVKDMNNRPAVFTPMTIVANPDFEKIRACGFSEYFWEPFTDTLNRYYPEMDVFKIWQEGMATGIFVPELHGRDHITVQLWMKSLREGDKALLSAFDNGFVSLNIKGVPGTASEFRAEFYFTSDDQKPYLENAVRESVSLFKDLFGRLPEVFVPGNGIFHPDFDNVVAETGLKYLNVSHSMPYPVNGGEVRYRHFITGQKGPGGLIYYTRNCAFEPSSGDYIGTDSTLRQIAAAFRWGKPAIISTHRVNFAGGISETVRDKGLSELKKLLKEIIRKWPDAEFMSSGDALDHMRSIN